MKIYNVNGLKVTLKDVVLGGNEFIAARHNALSALGFKIVGWF